MSSPPADKGALGQLGLGWMLGVIALALAIVPATLRVSGSGASFVSAWLGLWGAAALGFGLAAGALRAARPLSKALVGALAGLLVAAPVLIVLARILKTQTHHRPLGAATFAVMAAIVALGALALMARLYASSGRLSRMAFVALTGLGGLATLVLSLPSIGSLIDALLVSAAVAAAAFAKLPASFERSARIAGPLLLLIAVGLGIGVRSDALRAAASEHAPVPAAFMP